MGNDGITVTQLLQYMNALNASGVLRLGLHVCEWCEGVVCVVYKIESQRLYLQGVGVCVAKSKQSNIN